MLLYLSIVAGETHSDANVTSECWQRATLHMLIHYYDEFLINLVTNLVIMRRFLMAEFGFDIWLG